MKRRQRKLQGQRMKNLYTCFTIREIIFAILVHARRIKLFLNKLIKQGDKVAEMYRLALETEDENIKAKENRYYADKQYNKKRELIDQLINLCKENNIIYGIQDSDVKDVNYIIYFDLPDCEQISFHNSFENTEDIPEYKNEWDSIPCSTLPKIKQAILKHYPEEINDLVEKYKKKEIKI